MSDSASQQTFKRTTLQRADVPAGSYEAILGITEVPPNAHIARESHPGLEAGYILHGTATLSVDGQPQLTLGAGQSWNLTPGALHEFRAGPDGVKVLVSWIVEKGRAFASPAS